MNGFVYIPAAQRGNTIFNRQRGPGVPAFERGDSITASLVSREDGRALLRTPDDFSFSVPADSVKGDVGDVLHFKVINRDKSGLALRQIFPGAYEAVQAAIKRGNAGIEDVGNVAKSLEQMNEEAQYRYDSDKEEQIKVAQAVAHVRRSQRFMSLNSTQAAIAAIAAMGLDLHKISFFTLSNVIQEVEAMPEYANQGNAGTQANQANQANPKNPEASATSSATPPEKSISFEITESLPDGAVAYLLHSGKEITPESIYAARYSSAPEKPIDLAGWDSLDKQITKRFNREGIENNPKNIEAARFLVAYDLPITRHNIEMSVMLRNLDLVPKAIETVQKLPSIKPQDVQTILEAGKPLDLDHLFDAEAYQTQPAQSSQSGQEIVYVAEEKIITAKRQLAEIQWQMTVQAAIRLAHKGIKIDTEPLEELVNHLRTLERDGHAKALRAMGMEDTNQGINKMRDVFRVIQEMRPIITHAASNIAAKVLSKQVNFTLTGVHHEAITNQAQLVYEAGSMAPKEAFGQVENQFEGLLFKLGIKPTAENIRAATILSRNEMDITQSAIDSIKGIDAKMGLVMDRLHPMMAAQMLKDGLLPLNMHMDEILNYIRKFEDHKGYSGREKIAQYILEMDRSRVLTQPQREGMIAIYRMLNLIQKNGAAALGLALKQDAPLTLGSLMEAAKYYDEKGAHAVVDAHVDDDYGGKAPPKPPESIRASIAQAASLSASFGSYSGTLSYTDLLADSLTDKATPDNLQEWLKNENKPVEDVLKEAQQKGVTGFEPDLERAAQAMRQFIEAPPALITMLQKSGMIPTPDNIKAARESKENALIKALQGAANEIRANNKGLGAYLDEEFFNNENLISTLAGEGGQREIIEKLWNALGEAAPTEAVKEAQGLLAAQYAAADDGNLEIPIQLNGRMASLKMYTLNEDAVAGGTPKTFLSLNTEGLGIVQSFFTLDSVPDSALDSVQNNGSGNEKGKSVSMTFAVESQAARIKLESNKDLLVAMLQEAGYEISDITFTYAIKEEQKITQAPQGREAAVDPEEEVFDVPLELSDYEFRV